jgi:hypothetical protein
VKRDVSSYDIWMGVHVVDVRYFARIVPASTVRAVRLETPLLPQIISMYNDANI